METDASEYPVSQLVVSYDTTGILRFHVSEEFIESLAETLTTQVENADSVNDDITFTISIGDPGASTLRSRANDLLSHRQMVGLAYVALGETQSYSIDIQVGKDELKQVITNTPNTVGDDELVAHEFTMRPKAAWVAVHQLRAALHGAEHPTEAIDMDTVRDTIPEL